MMITWVVLLSIGLAVLVAAFVITLGVIEGPVAGIQDVFLEVVVWISGACVTVLGAWKMLPDPLKRLTAAALRKLPALPNNWKRRAVKNELEGNLNAALKEFNREGAGFIDHEIRIEWLTPNSDARESFFRSTRLSSSSVSQRITTATL